MFNPLLLQMSKRKANNRRITENMSAKFQSTCTSESTISKCQKSKFQKVMQRSTSWDSELIM